MSVSASSSVTVMIYWVLRGGGSAGSGARGDVVACLGVPRASQPNTSSSDMLRIKQNMALLI